jgi:hypothetical protein
MQLSQCKKGVSWFDLQAQHTKPAVSQATQTGKASVPHHPQRVHSGHVLSSPWRNRKQLMQT